MGGLGLDQGAASCGRRAMTMKGLHRTGFPLVLNWGVANSECYQKWAVVL